MTTHIVIGLIAWLAVAIILGLLLGRVFSRNSRTPKPPRGGSR